MGFKRVIDVSIDPTIEKQLRVCPECEGAGRRPVKGGDAGMTTCVVCGERYSSVGSDQHLCMMPRPDARQGRRFDKQRAQAEGREG
jgi:hypothetical protein